MLQYHTKASGWLGSFSRWTTWCLLLGLFVSGMSGCFGGNQKKQGATHAPGSKIDPEDLTGRWKMSMANRGAQTDIGLLEIKYDEKQTDAPFTVNLLGLGEAAEIVKIKSVKIGEEGQIDFEIQGPNVVSSFSGRLDGEAIWGSYLEPHFQLVPSKLERTDLEKLEPAAPAPVSHLEDYMKALHSKDSFIALDTFTEKAYRSPLLFEAFEAMAMHMKAEKLKRPEIEKFIDRYRKAVEVWGPRLAFLVDLNMGHALASTAQELDLAKSLIETAESKVTDEHPLEFSAKVVESWILLGDPERALKRLPSLRERDPSNPGLLWLYARAKEKANDTDEALLAYTKVMTIPGFEREQKVPGTDLPSLSALRLWKAKHNDTTKGFEEYALKAYDEVMKTFVPERKPAKVAADAKVPLIEMFTGTGCAPCIAADIALESLRHSYSPQEVVIVKYHQHNNFVDPLANDSSMKRLGFYTLNETPAIALNGQPVDQPLGVPSSTGALPILGSLRAYVENELKTTSPVSIKLEAKREVNDITIKADVSGIKTLEHQPRLYFVLVENEIRFPGPNGILMHSCVARAFPGGLKGLALPKGNSTHTETISLNKVREELLGHLKQFETEREFPLKPMDLKKLQVVAFVQATHTRVIQQSAMTEVTGDIPADPPAPAKSDAKTGDTKSGDQPETKPETKPEAKPESKPEEKSEAKPESKPDPKVEPKPETKDADKTDSQPESKPEAKPEPAAKPDAKPATGSEPQPEEKPAPTGTAPTEPAKPEAKQQ